ncbi:MAG: nucleotidyl transferase AbiEii/AbiGii toxin family protein [Bacteroidales bacterium]|nr:nucleotidyl transferase AbiEii/AbiGii toxin family protein [Bacteroidales bacterium]
MQQAVHDFSHLTEWLRLPDETMLRIFTETGRNLGMLPYAVEKDWWVVHTLAVIYTMDCAGSLVFKGGTSLSKGWNLIQRFSEDIDLALDREYLGFTGKMGNADVRRLRRKSHEYLTETFTPGLQKMFTEVGFNDVKVKHREVPNHDQDPMVIEVYYPKLTEKETYLKPDVLVEVGSRSLKEPFTDRTFATMVAENYTGQPYSDKPVTIPTVNPERTFLEKIFLLHEEFQRPEEKRRVDGLSRHLYDIEILSRTEFAEIALNNPELYDTIVAHRSRFSRISGVDFANQTPDRIKFLPPEHLLPDWEEDYKLMKESMIYGKALSFSELIEKLKGVQNRINTIKWN